MAGESHASSRDAEVDSLDGALRVVQWKLQILWCLTSPSSSSRSRSSRFYWSVDLPQGGRREFEDFLPPQHPGVGGLAQRGNSGVLLVEERLPNLVMDKHFGCCLDWGLLRSAGYLNDSPATNLELLRLCVPGALIRVFVEADQHTLSSSSFGQHIPVSRSLRKPFPDSRVVRAYAGKARALQDSAHTGCDIGVKKHAMEPMQPS